MNIRNLASIGLQNTERVQDSASSNSDIAKQLWNYTFSDESVSQMFDWLTSAMRKKIRRGVELDVDTLANSSTLKNIMRKSCKDFENENNTKVSMNERNEAAKLVAKDLIDQEKELVSRETSDSSNAIQSLVQRLNDGKTVRADFSNIEDTKNIHAVLHSIEDSLEGKRVNIELTDSAAIYILSAKERVKDSDNFLNSYNSKWANRDYYGNARMIVHFPLLLTEQEKKNYDLSIDEQFNIALKRAKKIGGSRYRGRDFGGGIVFQCNSETELIKDIKRVVAEAEKAEKNGDVKDSNDNHLLSDLQDELEHYEGVFDKEKKLSTEQLDALKELRVKLRFSGEGWREVDEEAKELYNDAVKKSK